MTELKPTFEQLHDPYVLQLIEAIAKRDDEIERLRELQARVAELEGVLKECEKAINSVPADTFGYGSFTDSMGDGCVYPQECEKAINSVYVMSCHSKDFQHSQTRKDDD